MPACTTILHAHDTYLIVTYNISLSLEQPLRNDAARVAEQEAMLRVQSTNNAKLKAELHDILVRHRSFCFVM